MMIVDLIMMTMVMIMTMVIIMMMMMRLKASPRPIGGNTAITNTGLHNAEQGAQVWGGGFVCPIHISCFFWVLCSHAEMSKMYSYWRERPQCPTHPSPEASSRSPGGENDIC